MNVITIAALAGALSNQTPTQLYAEALSTMNALPQPLHMSYELAVKSTGGGLSYSCTDGNATLGISPGRPSAELSLDGIYGLQENEAKIRDGSGPFCSTQDILVRPAWAPSWLATYEWMRYGLAGSTSKVTASPISTPAAIAPQSSALRTIAEVTAVSAGAYSVYDRGSKVCPNGADGHALHLIARRDAQRFPLTDVIVETAGMRFCQMRFTLTPPASVGTGARGEVVVDFDQNGPYWIVTRSRTEISIRFLGISAMSMGFELSYSNIAYPSSP